MNVVLEKYFSLVKRFVHEKAAVPSVGLDIGVRSFKLIELIKREGSHQVINWAVEPLDVNNPTESIATIFKRYNITSKSPLTAVFGKGTLIRFIEMPRMSLEDVKKAFMFEAEKYFPFEKDQIYTDCYILNPHGQDKKMSVLVAAVKKEIVHKRMELLSDIGFQANFIGINAVVLANAFFAVPPEEPQEKNKSLGKTEKGSAVAILDMGETACSLIILQDHLPAFIRDIYLGGQEFSQRVSNVMGISLEKAEAMKCRPEERLQEILNACDSIIMNLISEVRLSFDYFATERNMGVSKLYLTGGASLLNGIENSFSKVLDIPVETWNPFAQIKLAPSLLPDEFNRHISRLTVALGLALHET
jgi:type IV pilus assembly protein PilM